MHDLQTYKGDLILDVKAGENQADQANGDMRFLNVFGGMWEGFFEEETEDRVKIQAPIIVGYLNRIMSEWNLNRIGVDFEAGDDPGTGDDDVDLLNGLYRRDFRTLGSGKKALDNAVLEVFHCGHGAIKIGDRDDDEEDPENDLLTIDFRPIYNAYKTVIWDEASQAIDKSDARRCVLLKRYTRQSFLEAFPGQNPVSAYHPHDHNWANPSTHPNDAVFVATRYDKIRDKKEKIFVYFNHIKKEKETYSEERHENIKSELSKISSLEFIRERKIIVPRIKKVVFSGDTVLEEPTLIAGKFIPIASIYGHRAYVDGVETYKGAIRDHKDLSRVLNQQLSKICEDSSNSTGGEPIFDTEQIQSQAVKASWADNDGAFKLVDSLRDDEGNIIAPGPLGYTPNKQIDGNTSALLEASMAILNQMTGGLPQETQDPSASGKAILAARRIQDLSTQPMMENIATGVEWIGVIYKSKAQEIYTVPRNVRIVGADGKLSLKELMKMEVDPDSQKMRLVNDISNKQFNAIANVGPQFETLQEQMVETIKGVLELFVSANVGQEYIAPLIALLMQNVSGPGMDPIRKLGRKNMILQGLLPPADEEEQKLLEGAQNQTNPQEELVKAAAAQAEGEGRERDSKVIENIASSKLKEAQTIETLSEMAINESKSSADIETNRLKVLADINKQISEQVAALPL